MEMDILVRQGESYLLNADGKPLVGMDGHVARGAAADNDELPGSAADALRVGEKEISISVPVGMPNDAASTSSERSSSTSEEEGFAICRVCEQCVKRSALVEHAERCATRHKCEQQAVSELRQMRRTIYTSKKSSLEALVQSAVQRHLRASAPLTCLQRIMEEARATTMRIRTQPAPRPTGAPPHLRVALALWCVTRTRTRDVGHGLRRWSNWMLRRSRRSTGWRASRG